VDGRYTTASDIHSLGVVLNQWASGLVVTEAGARFLELLRMPAGQQHRTAAELLQAGVAWFDAMLEDSNARSG
jgi:hypothetical protein